MHSTPCASIRSYYLGAEKATGIAEELGLKTQFVLSLLLQSFGVR